MLDFLREGLAEQGRHSPADLAIYDQEYRRLMRIARQLAAEIDWRTDDNQSPAEGRKQNG